MATRFLIVLILMDYSIYSNGFLDDFESADVNVVKLRLEEEKEKRLLLQNDVEMLMLKFAKMERKLTTKLGTEDYRCTADDKNVSFFAIHSRSHEPLSVGQILIFGKVTTNNGDGYSPSSGTFRAPSRGVYVFTTHILSLGSNTVHAALYKNGDRIANVYALNEGSQSLLVNLEVGDEVFVQATVAGYVHGSSYSTFHGFLIN